MRFRNGIVALVVATTTFNGTAANTPGAGLGPSASYGYSYQQHQYAQQPWQSQEGTQPTASQQHDEPSIVEGGEEKPPLPAGWSEHFDPDSGQYYYYNSSDGTTTWDRPPPDESQENSLVGDGDTNNQPSQDASRVDNESEDRDYSGSFQPTSNDYSTSENPTDVRENQDMQGSPPYEGSWGTSSSIPQEDQPPTQTGNAYHPQQVNQQQNKEWESPSPNQLDRDGPPFEETRRGGQPIRQPDRGQQPHEQQPTGWGMPREHERTQSNSQGQIDTPLQHQRSAWQDPAQSSEEPTPKQGWGAPTEGEKTKPQGQAEREKGWGLPNPEACPQQPSPWGLSKPENVPQHADPGRSANVERQGPTPSRQGSTYRGEHSSIPPPGQENYQAQVPEQIHRQQPPVSQPPHQSQPPLQHQGTPRQHPSSVVHPNSYGSPQGQRYENYGSFGGHGRGSQYGQYRPPPQAYGQHPPQQSPQQTTGEMVSQQAEQGTSAVKEVFGRSLQSLMGLGNRTKDRLEQAGASVANTAAAASQTLTEKSTTIWGQAKSALGGVFENNEGTSGESYSMSGQYGQQQQQQQRQQPGPGSRPPSGYPGRGGQPPYPGRYGGPPGQQGPLQGQPPLQGQYPGRPMQPRSDSAYPQMQRPQQPGPRQAQYGGQGYPPRGMPQQGGGPQPGAYPPGQGGGPQSGAYPPRQGGGPQSRVDGDPSHGNRQPGRDGNIRSPPDNSQRPQQQPRASQPDPWAHPGLTGDM